MFGSPRKKKWKTDKTANRVSLRFEEATPITFSHKWYQIEATLQSLETGGGKFCQFLNDEGTFTWYCIKKVAK